jgi:hypothetical protein
VVINSYQTKRPRVSTIGCLLAPSVRNSGAQAKWVAWTLAQFVQRRCGDFFGGDAARERQRR